MSKQINYQKLEALIDITEKNNNDIDTYRKIIKSFIITDFNENVCRNFNKELNKIPLLLKKNLRVQLNDRLLKNQRYDKTVHYMESYNKIKKELVHDN
ncbi:hypothetical protein [uncultured Streptococcus sp.]|jgi:hypothetical protein|uniref:hypothetical protein n=1 Tax=uncultured Streptococcus sp. TaxID=83427 RepID=UPI002889B942|nr:hypothetical protein [uncultured Streptococcus sp.]